MPLSPAATAPLSGFSEIADRFSLCLCDVWGVVHNGVVAHRGAVEALLKARAAGMFVVLVTNAPRPSAAIVQQLRGLDVPDAAYDAIVTSGDVCRALIGKRAGRPVFHLGPPRDLPLLEGLDAPRVVAEDAEYVLCTGLFDDERETAESYAELLAGFAARGLTMICANPDLVVDRGGRIVPCAGSVALAYERIGGAVIYAGKPHAPIYEAAVVLMTATGRAAPEKARICAIGDAIRTDIAGAHAFGASGVMVLAGIHAQDLVEASWEDRHGWFAQQSHRPDYALPHLVW